MQVKESPGEEIRASKAKPLSSNVQSWQKEWSDSNTAAFLAPLAGVSDHAFRRVCYEQGAHLAYVEMLSATALLYKSPKTYEMAERHPDEPKLGVQLTAKTHEELEKATAILDQMNFDAIDINMGCPVKKIVKQGCGSAVLKDPELVYKYVAAARRSTSKPLTAKIRMGWDHQSINHVEVAQAIESAGADWMVIHGRCRSDRYDVAVNLESIKECVDSINIPVLGNGNIFSNLDSKTMIRHTGAAGVMVSRGALGNPWVFKSLKQISQKDFQPTIEEWASVVDRHLLYQQEIWGDTRNGAVRMRKHLLWYSKGWNIGKAFREKVSSVDTISDARVMIAKFVLDTQNLAEQKKRFDGITQNPKDFSLSLDKDATQSERANMTWDPKWEMDRKLDRGVGEDQLDT